MLAKAAVPIIRKEPTADDLANPNIAVIDVGGEHNPTLGNFDHHQFPKDHPPLCALSLVLQYLGVYEDALSFCDWLEPAEWFDTRGPVETGRWLGVPRETLAKLNSPIDATLLRRFATTQELKPNEPLWEIMRWIGSDLLDYIHHLRSRLDFIDKHSEIWELKTGDTTFKVIYLPRTEPMPDEPSSGLVRYLLNQPNNHEIIGMIYPDRRSGGFGLNRHNDHPNLDFTQIKNLDDVHFAHARGFVAKTSATEPQRLRELMALAWCPQPKS